MLETKFLDKPCPFFKTKVAEERECKRLGVQTWEEMEQSLRKI